MLVLLNIIKKALAIIELNIVNCEHHKCKKEYVLNQQYHQ